MPLTNPPEIPKGQKRKRGHGKPGSYYDTPTRAKVQGIVEFCEAEEVALNFDTPLKRKAAKHFHVSGASGYDFVKMSRVRSFHNREEPNETRGRKYKGYTGQDREADSIWEEVVIEFEGKILTWE
ncbi:hypothetical protein ABVK25_008839 [Lepraria finkii]|uniref:Uncharacterized protein n=1 Tax=Lepraria finkii TaxID=1340010 RepID=A0ABR4B202_9LECA